MVRTSDAVQWTFTCETGHTTIARGHTTIEYASDVIKTVKVLILEVIQISMELDKDFNHLRRLKSYDKNQLLKTILSDELSTTVGPIVHQFPEFNSLRNKNFPTI